MRTKKTSKSMSKYGMNNVLLIVLCSLIFSACNISKTEQNQHNQSEHLQGKIILWAEVPLRSKEAQVSPAQKVIKASIDNFHELNPNVQVLTKIFPPGEIQDAFKRQVKRGAGPDLLLVRVDDSIIPIIKSGKLRALDESDIEESLFRRETLKHIRYQAKIYGFPLYLSTQVLCYNKDKVEDLANTLSDLIQQARQGYSVGIHSGFVETYWGTGIFGGQLFNARGQISSLQWNHWAEWMKWLQNAQNEPNVVLSDKVIALRQAFLEERLAYLTCQTGWIAGFEEILGTDKLGVALLPKAPNQSATPVLQTGVLFFSQASSSKQHRLALRLAQFLTNVEQQEQAEAAIPFISGNKGVRINPRLFPIRSALLEQAKTAVALSLEDLENGELTTETGNILYQQILAGEISPDEAAAQLKLTVRRHYQQEK